MCKRSNKYAETRIYKQHSFFLLTVVLNGDGRWMVQNATEIFINSFHLSPPLPSPLSIPMYIPIYWLDIANICRSVQNIMRVKFRLNGKESGRRMKRMASHLNEVLIRETKFASKVMATQMWSNLFFRTNFTISYDLEREKTVYTTF